MVLTSEDVSRLHSDPSRLRNICILAHVDHGKTTLSDSLIATNGIISAKMAGRVRYLDSREDEQLRGITMKSSGISLYFKVVGQTGPSTSEPTTSEATLTAPTQSTQEYLINLIDSPGHVDFSSEVTAASLLSDGCLVLVDAVEGVCTQTITVLHAAWKSKLKPILVINKIDRLAHELKLTPLEAYMRMERIVEEANAAVGEFFQGDRSQEATRKWLEKSRSKADLGDDTDADYSAVEIQGDAEADVDSEPAELVADSDEDIYFDPVLGNVVFASAIDGWAFRPAQFARMYATRLGFKEATLKKFLWGDFYLDPKRKRILGAKHLKGRQEGMKPLFVQFVLENLFAVYDATVMNYNRTKINKIISALSLRLTPRDLATKDHRALLQSIFAQWLPLSTAVLLAIIDRLPDPRRAQAERVGRLLEDALGKDGAGDVRTAMERCVATEDEPVVAYVSKVFTVSDDMMPKELSKNGKAGDLTADELRDRRAEIIRRKRMIEKLEGLSVDEVEERVVIPEPVVEPAAEEAEAEEEDEDVIADPSSKGGRSHLIGFARIYSGSIKVGDKLHLLGPKYDPRFPLLHRTEFTVKGLYLLMGRELQALQRVSAGAVFGIRGLGTRIVKTGTISSTLLCPSLSPRLSADKPIVRCAIEAKDPRQIRALAKGLKLLNRADPSVEVIQHESGEQVVVAAGELHLERLLKDLREVFARGVELRVSDPVVPFRETIAPVPATNAAANMNSLGVRQDVVVAAEATRDEGADASPVLAGGRRPATESTPTAPMPHGTVVLSTPNKLARLRIRCLPLPLPVLEFLEEQADTIKGIVEAGDRRNPTRTLREESGEDSEVFEAEELKRTDAGEKFLEALKAKFAESVTDGAGGPDKEIWATVVDNISAFGSKRSGPNILVNHIRGYNRTPWIKATTTSRAKRPAACNNAIRSLLASNNIAPSGSSVADTAEGSTIADTASNAEDALSVDYSARGEELEGADAEIVGKALGVKDFDGSINTGFQLSMQAGPLCAETVVGVCIFMEEFKVENLDGEEPSKVAALSGQVISTMQLACKQAFLQWSPRLCLAMYSVDVQATADVLGKVYAVIAKRKGQVLSEELQEGTPFFNVTCLLPVVESFGFADDLRKKSSGAANPQLIFSGFETLDLDPFWVPNTEEELEDLGEKADRENVARKYMEQVRKRKGLYVEKKIIEHGEKQRTLKSK